MFDIVQRIGVQSGVEMAFINSASAVDGVGIRAIEDGIQQIIAVARQLHSFCMRSAGLAMVVLQRVHTRGDFETCSSHL